MARITLDKWIAEVLNDPHKDGHCSSISCIHKEGMGEREVFTMKFEKGAKLDTVELAELFRRKAEIHVQDIPNSHLFYLKARYGGRSESEAQIPFRINGGSELAHGETEPPTPEGRASQSMRQSEFGFQFWAKQIIEVFRMNNERMTADSNTINAIQGENRDMVSIFKELIFQQAQNNHSHKMEELKYLRESQFYGQMAKLGPALVNTMTGKEVFPQSTADSALIEGLLDQLTEEQVKAMQGFLPPQVMGLLMARATDHWKKKAEAEQTAVEAVKNRPDPLMENGADNDATAQH